MATWQSQLQKLVRVGEQLPEPLNLAFSAERPSGRGWPSRLPSCPALQEFYALCNGGTFNHYSLGRLADLQHLRGHGGQDGIEPGRYVIIGDTEFGHPLVWDSIEDRVGYYDPDGADGLVLSEETGAEGMGRSMADFLAGLFAPPRRTRGDQVQQLWGQALAELERIPEPAAGPDRSADPGS
jgi:hypothetical protein